MLFSSNKCLKGRLVEGTCDGWRKKAQLWWDNLVGQECMQISHRPSVDHLGYLERDPPRIISWESELTPTEDLLKTHKSTQWEKSSTFWWTKWQKPYKRNNTVSVFISFPSRNTIFKESVGRIVSRRGSNEIFFYPQIWLFQIVFLLEYYFFMPTLIYFAKASERVAEKTTLHLLCRGPWHSPWLNYEYRSFL